MNTIKRFVRFCGRAAYILPFIGWGCGGSPENIGQNVAPDQAGAMAACSALYGNACANVTDCQGNSLVGSFGAPVQPSDYYGWVYSGPLAGDTVHVHDARAAFACSGAAVQSLCGSLSQTQCATTSCSWTGAACVMPIPALAVTGAW
jgi:hypothetical protein